MTSNTPARLYRRVLPEDQQRLEMFRDLRPLRSLTHGGVEWSYLVGGEGAETLVVLPMMMRSADTLFPILPELEAGRRVIAISFPAVASMLDLVEGVAAVLKKERVNRVALLGIGLGGMVAQCFARRYKKVAQRLILAHTCAPASLPLRRLTARARLLRALPAFLARPLLVGSFLRMIGPEARERPLWRALLTETVRAWGAPAERSAHWAAAADFACERFEKEDLADWRGRILIVESADDHVLTVAQRRTLKETYPAAHVRRMERGGHGAALVRPVEFASIVGAFLSAVDVHGPVEKAHPAGG